MAFSNSDFLTVALPLTRTGANVLTDEPQREDCDEWQQGWVCNGVG